MLARVLTGLIGGAAFVYLFSLDYSVVLATCALLNALALYEYCRLTPNMAFGRIALQIVWGSLLYALAARCLVHESSGEEALVLLVLLALGYGLAAMLSWRRAEDSAGHWLSLRGLLLVALPFAFIPAVAAWPGQFPFILLLIGASFGADTGALAAGRLLGRTPLAPLVSPKKTWEGALGGLLSGGMCWALAALLFSAQLRASAGIFEEQPLGLILGAMFGAGLLISLVGIGGDLVFSLFKREAQIKDYGSLLPGHGGILDRFDSMLFTAPLVYLFCKLCLQL